MKGNTWVVAVALWAMCSSALADSCVSPILPPKTFVRENWQELIELVAGKGDQQMISEVQSLKETGHGRLNTDFYAIELDGTKHTPASLMTEIRKTMSSLIFSGTSYSIEPYDNANRKRWQSDQPRDSVMTFTLAEIPGVISLERGSVILSCFEPTSFVFSTVTTAKDGLHPVSGNRAFGVVRLGGGSLVFFTKAADRIVDRGAFAMLPEAGREAIFSQGHKVWIRLLDNFEKKYSDLHPRNRMEYSQRVSYP